MMRMSKSAVVVSLLFLSGCSALSKKQCEQMDWNSLGYQKAMNGQTIEQQRRYYEQSCIQEHDVKPDFAAFEAGFKTGIDYLCTGSGGVALGSRGASYRGTCPREKEATFLQGYATGRVGFLESRVKALEDEVSSLRWQLSGCQSTVSSLQNRTYTCPTF